MSSFILCTHRHLSCTKWSLTFMQILFFVFLVNLKIMTAVTSQQCLPAMIKDVPPGYAKDVVTRLCGHTDR